MKCMERIALVLACAALWGAAVPVQGQVPGGDYYIHGIFNPTIADARKVEVRPELIDTILPTLPVTYGLLPVKADIPARVDSIAPASLRIAVPQQRLYKGYVKAGFGLYTTPVGELYYDQGRSRKDTWGIHLKHFSSNGGLDDVGPSDYSFNNAAGHYTHFIRDHEVGGRIDYDRRRISYYGLALNDSIQALQDSIGPLDDDLRQIYNDIGFSGRIRSMYKDSTKLAYDAGIGVHSYSNLTGSRETNMRVEAALRKQEGRETYGADVLIDNNAYRAKVGGVIGDIRQNGTLIGVSPSVATRGDKYDVQVGAGLFVDAMGRTTFHFFPQARMSYRLFDDILVPYAGVDGERRRNSFRSLTRENPWLGGTPVLANSSLMYDLYGGLRGSFSQHMGFDVRVSRSRMRDMPLFVNTDNAPFGDQMAAVYDQVDIFTISGSLHYHVRESLDLTGRVEVATYETDRVAEAWNLPPYTVAFGAKYDLRQKLILRGEALFLGQRFAQGAPRVDEEGVVFGHEVVELDGFLDLYLGVEYRYTRRLSVFLEVSNLSASKYERWYRHPVQRGLVLGGATYAF
jgi:hypothetical protein